jgi:glutathione synthase/RimK-type ligase-like ATP-grasp enzyme
LIHSLSGTPFLCQFVDSVSAISDKQYNNTDFKYILTNELKIIPEDYHFSDKLVLMLSRSQDYEADLIGIELLRRGIDYVRLNIEDIARSFSITCSIESKSNPECKIKIGSTIINTSDITVALFRNFDYQLSNFDVLDLNSVFIYQQWSDALQILYSRLKCGWINSPNATRRASNRICQLMSAKDAGFNIPSTLITNDPQKAHDFYHKSNGNMILKVLHHHEIEIDNKLYSIHTHQAKENDLPRFSDLVYSPCILQEKLRKHSELRVTVVGNQVFAAEIIIGSLATVQDDIHRCQLSQLTKKPVELKREDKSRCIKMINSLGLRYGAIDFLRAEDGQLDFLEINPTGDWIWIERQTKLPITKAVVDLIKKTRSF